jgi:hypothetical protein
MKPVKYETFSYGRYINSQQNSVLKRIVLAELLVQMQLLNPSSPGGKIVDENVPAVVHLFSHFSHILS